MLPVWAVRPLATVAPLGGAGLMDDCQLNVDLNDDVVSVDAWAPMDRPAMCCAQLVPDYDPDRLLSGRDIEVGVTDLTQDIQVRPDERDSRNVGRDGSCAVTIACGRAGRTTGWVLSRHTVVWARYRSRCHGYQSGYPSFARRVSDNA